MGTFYSVISYGFSAKKRGLFFCLSGAGLNVSAGLVFSCCALSPVPHRWVSLSLEVGMSKSLYKKKPSSENSAFLNVINALVTFGVAEVVPGDSAEVAISQMRHPSMPVGPELVA